MTLLQARTTKVALCVVVFFVASGFAGVITVTNPSFETLPTGGLPDGGCGTGCSFSTGVAIPGWTNVEFFSGQLQPGTQLGNHTMFDSLPDGITTAYANSGTIEQTVGAKVVDGATYTLTVDLGQRHDTAFTASADLLVGSTMFAATGSTPSPGGWSTYTATFTGTAANAGETITIQLNSSGLQANFDNVRLTASSTVPEPSSMLLLGSGVLVLVQGLRRKLL